MNAAAIATILAMLSALVVGEILEADEAQAHAASQTSGGGLPPAACRSGATAGT